MGEALSDPSATMGGVVGLYRERRAHPALRGLLDCVWTQTVGRYGHVQRVVPDGCIDLIWLDGSLEIAGPDTGPRCVPLNRGGMIAGVRLRPGAARLLLDSVPASEVRDCQLDLAELWGSRARQLADRLASAAGPDNAAAMLESAALARLPRLTRDFAMESAIAQLRRSSPPALPVLAERLGISERQLRRRFVETVGYGPKTLSMILRLRQAMRVGVGRGGLAELAAATGYADQAHLSREVRRFTGLTALAWFAQFGGGDDQS